MRQVIQQLKNLNHDELIRVKQIEAEIEKKEG